MKKGFNNTQLGKYVRSRRLARNLDVRTCAERSGLNDAYWRKLEHGHYSSPSLHTLRQVATAVDCPLAELHRLCGYSALDVLPAFGPYLRATTDLSPEDIATMERIFQSFTQDKPDNDRSAA
jgi:transcriptional regulator with XRE-family HTH domain